MQNGLVTSVCDMTACFDDLNLVDPSPNARRLFWHALSVGRVWRDEMELHPARDKAGAFLFWVVSGHGTLQVQDQSWELNPGPRFWLVNLAIPRAYIPVEGQRLLTEGVRFSGPGWDTWREAMQPGPEFHFRDAADSQLVRRQMHRIQQLVTRRRDDYEWQVHECLTRILGKLLAERKVFSESSRGAVPEPVARVLETVLEDPARAWRAADLAKIARVSYSSLRVVFKQYQKESLSDFLQKTRLHQARLLLVNERLAMKEIAARLNFSSEFYFSQWFRNQTGVSPTAFRAHQRD